MINVRAALQRITDRINTQPDIRAAFQDNKADELRIVVSSPVATIKIEVSPVARGTLHSAEFDGMTFEKVECEDLASVRPMMLSELRKHFTERDHAFLMSFKRGQPDWALFDYHNAADLPAIRWKLQNINKLAKNQAKHQEQLDKLKQVLDDWLVNANAE